MKKRNLILSALILSSVMLFSACGKGTKSVSGGISPDIQAIKDRGVLKVGVNVDVPKFGYKDPATGKIEGLEIDIAKSLAKEILGDENKIELQPVTGKTKESLLDKSEVDVLVATSAIAENKKETFNFSDSYFTDSVTLMVKKNSGINDLTGLAGKKIGIAQNSNTRKVIGEEAKKLGVTATYLEFATNSELKKSLDAGSIDCVSLERGILNRYIDDSVTLLTIKLNPEDYGIVSKKGNDGIAKVANDTVSKMKDSGDLKKLVDKWAIK